MFTHANSFYKIIKFLNFSKNHPCFFLRFGSNSQKRQKCLVNLGLVVLVDPWQREDADPGQGDQGQAGHQGAQVAHQVHAQSKLGEARWSRYHICLWILTLADSTTFSTRMMALRAASSPLMRAPAFSTALVSWASGIRMSTSKNAWCGKVQIRVSFNIVKVAKLIVFLPQQMSVQAGFCKRLFFPMKIFLWGYICIRKRERQYLTIHACSECGKFAFAPLLNIITMYQTEQHSRLRSHPKALVCCQCLFVLWPPNKKGIWVITVKIFENWACDLLKCKTMKEK